MILYLHGFASCGDSTKSRLLKERFGAAEVLSQDLPVAPEEAMDFLDTLIVRENVTLLVGSSLGGFYATALSARHGIDAVLINPSVHPYRTLAPYVGMNRYWCSGEPFEWKGEYLLQLARIAEQMQLPDAELLVLLQTGDEVLDYRAAAEVYAGYEVVIEEGGSHRFENLGDYLERIEVFYRRLKENPVCD
jgi:predicted esterase YcpF (UPF0227 family)